MENNVRRRDFMKAACTVGLGSLDWSNGLSTVSAEAPVASRPRLLVGCCAYSYRKYLESGRMTMEDFIGKAVESGYQGVDITTYWLKSTESAYLAGLRRLAYRNAIPLSGAAIGTNMCQPDSAKRQDELEKIK